MRAVRDLRGGRLAASAGFAPRRLTKQEKKERMQRRIMADRKFVGTKVDPVLGALLERLYIARPPNVVAFMLCELRGENAAGPAQDSTPEEATAAEKRVYMRKHVTPIMHKLLKKLIAQRPTDVRQFLLSKLETIDAESAEADREAQLASQAGNQSENQNESDGLGLAAGIQNMKIDGEVQRVQRPSSAASTRAAPVPAPAPVLSPTEPRTVTVLVVGIDGAGKTTMLNTLQGRFGKATRPTLGFERVQMMLDEVTTVSFYDLGGSAKMRDMWCNYYGDVHGMVYVVDASDAARIGESAQMFKSIMSHKRLANKPVLVLGNKQDAEGAATADVLGDAFGVAALSNVSVSCCTAMAATEDAVDARLESSLESIFGTIKEQFGALQQRVADDLAAYEAEQQRKQQEQKERVLKRVLEKAFPTEGEAEECWNEADGLQALSEEVGCASVEELSDGARAAAKACNYQRLALQMIGAMNVPISKKKTPMSWEDIISMLERVKEQVFSARAAEANATQQAANDGV